ncbi:MAG TPA: serine hydrolase domain-containing protein, partial [Pyrinomonadaceae bacterium]|nr:serine hydrolase domain-containing protein [Pyrinomonadaceae bacterium]
MRLIRYACLVLLLLAPLELNAKPPDFTELEKLVPEELKERNTPGAVIAIVSGDRVVYQKAFGLANVETGAAMQPEMLFRLGSTTKMFTAAALVTLAEQNTISLNEPIGNRVKGLNPRIAALTPHQLLSN